MPNRSRKPKSRDFNQIARSVVDKATGVSNGTIGVSIHVNTDGRVSNCRVIASVGDNYVDATMCQLVAYYVRFRPALDASGRPVAQDVTWYPRWWKP